MSLVLSLADADLASGRTSITLSSRPCKVEDRWPPDDGHGPGRRLAQPDHELRRGGARPAAREPGQLADPSEGAAGRARRRARCGRLGPAGPGQSADRLRRRRPRPGGARPVARRADRPGPVRQPRSGRGGARPRDPRPDRRDGRARRREAEGAPGGRHRRRCGAARPPRRPRRQRAEGGADRPRPGPGAARGALRQAGRPVPPRRPPDPVRRRDGPGCRGAAPRRGGADPARDRPALRRPARPDLARRRVQRAPQAGQGLGRRGRRREAVHDARDERASDAQAPAPLARRHPGPARRPLDPRVDCRPVRPLRAGQPARAAGPLHRAAQSRRHRAGVPGGPQPGRRSGARRR